MKIKIIAMALNDWNGPWMNRQQLLSRLAHDYNVVYTTKLLTHWQLKSSDWKNRKWIGNFTNQDNIWLNNPPKWLITISQLKIWNKVMYWLESIRLQKQANKLKGEKLLIYAFRPEFWPIIKQVNPDFLVYHVYDVFDVEEDWSENKKVMQNQLLAKASLVIASSQQMAERLKQTTNYSGDIQIIYNGADVNSFKNNILPTPLDIKNIPHPRLGYVGRLNKKVDFELVANLASRNTDWNLIFVGPEGHYDEASQLSVDLCKSLPNVHFLGGKPHTELPFYVNAMDVSLLCYVIDKKSWAYFGYPLKLHECLATGKPVISAPLNAVLEYGNVVEIAENLLEWESAINNAIDRSGVGTPQTRLQVAEANSWDVRVAQLKKLIDNISL